MISSVMVSPSSCAFFLAADQSSSDTLMERLGVFGWLGTQ